MIDTRNGHQPTIDPTLADMIESLLEAEARSATDLTGTTPSDLFETWDYYYLQVALPGIDPRHLRVQVTGRRLTLQGVYARPPIETAAPLWQLLPEGEFCLSFPLPEEVNGDKARAVYEHGILTISLPKVSYLCPDWLPVEVRD
jgi:HSP20 family protein